MRRSMHILAAGLLLLAGASPALAGHGGGGALLAPALPLSFAAAGLQDPPKLPDIDVEVTKETRTTTWYADPKVIALAVGGVLALILIIALLSRGTPTTTIVKD